LPSLFKDVDVAIAAAAVADYRPKLLHPKNKVIG
jgi:phosphopantothenoylcysteine synthetase/decarboxylase